MIKFFKKKLGVCICVYHLNMYTNKKCHLREIFRNIFRKFLFNAIRLTAVSENCVNKRKKFCCFNFMVETNGVERTALR